MRLAPHELESMDIVITSTVSHTIGLHAYHCVVTGVKQLVTVKWGVLSQCLWPFLDQILTHLHDLRQQGKSLCPWY